MDNEPNKHSDSQIPTRYPSETKSAPNQDEKSSTINAPSDEHRQLHEQSVERYPDLNLSEGEFVVLEIKRNPIGLLMPMIAVVAALLAIIAVLIIYPSNPSDTLTMLPSYSSIFFPMLIIMLLICAGASVAVWVYFQNSFFLTNESIIDITQQSLFSRREQTVSLSNIEDASFKQTGMIQMMLNYGSIRVSIEGAETIYRFRYVSNPRMRIATLNNTIETFKNGRPVER